MTYIPGQRLDLPVRVLSSMDKRAAHEAESLMKKGTLLMLRELSHAQPDAADQSLNGINQPLAKALEVGYSLSTPGVRAQSLEGSGSKAVRDLKRRQLHGGATSPAKVPDEDLKRLINLMPHLAGILTTRQSLKKTGTGREAKKIEPLSQVEAYAPFTMLELVEAFKGKKTTIHASSNPDTGLLTVTKGSAQYFADKLSYIPAVEMWVRKVRTSEPADESGVDPFFAETLGMTITRPYAYMVPSTMEPIAEVARNYDKETFLKMVAGGMTDEEQVAEAQALEKDQAKAQLWFTLYNAAKLRGLSHDAAETLIQGDPKWARAKSLADGTMSRSKVILERWFKRHSELETAWEKSALYAQEDLVNLPSRYEIDPDEFWTEANKGLTTASN